jgi:CDP-glycerol glycerophosphotransferase (TagB/SpsB family)/glycosyltransferase involved in cell wall biosynthesis
MIFKNLKLLILFSLLTKLQVTTNFIFSVIITIYNTGRYLDDCICSVINQTVNIKDIQIILVNDGSTDKEEEKCLEYKEIFPKNIVYIKIKHGGVSKARNIGIEYAKGKYINFMDSDDKWDKNAFNYVLLFFKYHRKINIIGCRIKFFEALESFHPLDYKFYKTRVVNLTEEYNCIQLSSSSSFFKYSLIKNYKFKEGVFNGEDTRLINNYLLLNPLLGVVREALYFYRRRADSTSAIQNSGKNEQYYFSIIQLVDEYLIERSKKLYNRILPFIQFYLAYDILFRITFPTFNYIEKSRLLEYFNHIHNILYQIEDKYIIQQKILSLKEKFVALSKKYDYDIRDDIIIQNNLLIYSGHILMNMKKNKNIITWRILEINNNSIHLEGKDNCILKANKFFYYCKLGNKIFYPKYLYYSGYDLITMYGNIDKGRIVLFDIPLENKNHQILKFYLSYKDNDIEIFPSLGWFTHIPNINDGYYNSGRFIIKPIEDRLNIYVYNESLKEIFEEQYCKYLKQLMKTNIITLRKKYFENEKKKLENTTEIWIINDKQNLAGDNGEFFFRFLKKKKPKRIKFYFAIKNDCQDYKRLRPLGNIIDLDSEDYLNTFLIADKIISSMYESWVDNPFGTDFKYLRDLFHFDFIFIQHGIIKDDLSRYLNRISKNYSLIVTSSNKEFKSILDYNYHYKINNVILSGLPRYDSLQSLKIFTKIEKIILLIPTWRIYLKGSFNIKTYESIYSNSFNLTIYYNFYNNLINNDELLFHMEKMNYKGIFCLHPYLSKQWKDFKQNKIFSVLEYCDFQNLILKSSILITDYSSIFFDFAYLKKPIIYIHFDYDEYRYFQYAKGYFDYIKHGFGPVCNDQKCTIDEIIKKMKNHSLIENKFLKRINRFFKYTDEKNCERLYIKLLGYSESSFNNNYKIYIYFIIIFGVLIKINFKHNFY